MPISEKIKEKINHLDESDDFKKLLLEVLEYEDKGKFQYSDGYEKLVKKYLQKRMD